MAHTIPIYDPNTFTPRKGISERYAYNRELERMKNLSLRETIDSSMQYVDYVAENLDKSMAYTEYIANNFSELNTELNKEENMKHMQTFDNFTRGIPSTRIPKPVDKIEDPIQRETPKGRKIRPNFTHLTNDSMLCI